MHYTLVRGSSHQIWQPWAFLRQIDPWMTFDPRWGPFENMPTNLVGPSPTPMPSFSSIRRSMAKCIAGHTYTHTHTHTHRVWYFNNYFWLTPAWPLTLSMHYTLVWGPFYQIWWPQGISKEFDLCLTLADPCMTFDPVNALRSGQGFIPPNLVAIGHC